MTVARTRRAALLLAIAGLLAVLGMALARPDTSWPVPVAIGLLAVLVLLGYAERAATAAATLQDVLDGIPDPVLIISSDFRVTAMNRAARASCGEQTGTQRACYRVMEQLGAPCSPASRPCTLLSGEACVHRQPRASADGNERETRILMSPLFDRRGRYAGAVEVLHDVSDSERVVEQLQQAEADAETASRAKSECLTMMSHEVRTPMNAVLGMADLLQLTDLTRKQVDYVRTIQSSGSTLVSMVDNVLDFAELQAGELVVDDKPFDPRRTVENVLEVMGFQAYTKGLELGCRIDAAVPPTIIGDQARLRQVLMNLVSNAVRFTDSGEVMVTVGIEDDAEHGPTWHCSVTDTGVGIAPKLRATLFEPFVSEDHRAGRREQGSGLGLTVCRWLIGGMGGRIIAEGLAPRGTCVRFELPLRVPDRLARESRAVFPSGLRALVVHGNAQMAMVLCEYLADWGIGSDRVAGAVAALAHLQGGATERRYDLAVIDTSLEGTDGVTLALQLRAGESAGSIPLLLLTPIAYPLEIGQITEIGTVRCVNKPVLPSELRYNLERLASKTALASGRVPDAAAAAATPQRILIAEDNPLNRRLLKNMLASLNFDADTVEDGPAVLEALRERPYDVILMDCQMPGMDGEDVARRIRGEPDTYAAQPVIIAVTADVSAGHRRRCLDAGMDDFIAKPVRRQLLLECLGKLHADEHSGPAPASPRDDDAADTITVSLEQRARDDGDFLRGYIDLFVDDTRTRLQQLEEATDQHDWQTVRSQSHALKGACLEMGAADMGRQCEAVRRATDNDDRSRLPEEIHKLEREFDRIRPVLEATREHLG